MMVHTHALYFRHRHLVNTPFFSLPTFRYPRHGDGERFETGLDNGWSHLFSAIHETFVLPVIHPHVTRPSKAKSRVCALLRFTDRSPKPNRDHWPFPAWLGYIDLTKPRLFMACSREPMLYDKRHVVPFDYFALMTQPTPESDHFRATLLTLQSDLLAVSSTGKESAQPVELDQTAVGRVSRMDALQQQAMAQAAQQRRHIQLQRIESALQRLENGQFGWCVRCGEEISRKRLDVDPTAPLCIACADGRRQ